MLEFEMDGFGQKPSFESFVAKVPEENKSKEGFTTVGVALYFYTYNSWKGRALYLDVLYVMTEFRGFGIGKGLLSRVAKVAREKSCQIMELNVLGHNSQSRGFYAAHGAQDITIREGWHTQRFEEESLNKLAHNAP
uniref:thialysine N-epsilon-acetyltransferase-like n=1 Tax=Doryrhamphus excisus TaxID=161450 RepID=UPI0025AE2551|nr:thialysine N-epsilon-acetyltransferase-like [Doryrhamphus excisus]